MAGLRKGAGELGCVSWAERGVEGGVGLSAGGGKGR
jgi:hypothetical protein